MLTKLQDIRVALIAIACFLLIGVLQPAAADYALETSIVSLVIRSEVEVVETDYFFELLDVQDYVLLPLGALSGKLEIEVHYKREQNWLTAYHPGTDTTLEIDLEQGLYVDHPEWMGEPPILLEGDFYVSTAAFEALTGARVEWSSRLQELSITHDAIRREEEPHDTPELRIRSRPEEVERVPQVVGLDVSIGSIQYRVGFEYIQDTEGEGKFVGRNQINIHGRAGDWALSTSQRMRYDFSSGEVSVSFPLLRARHLDDERVIVIGDSRVSFADTLQRTNIRGFLYQYPRWQVSTLSAFTSVEGTAEPGSTVYLYVNDQFLGEEYVYREEDTYRFENIPLRIKRTNTLKVVIQTLDGEREEIVKTVAASPRILEEGTDEGLFVLGSYRQAASPGVWEGDLIGFEGRRALSDRISAQGEILGTRSRMALSEQIEVGSVIGLSLRGELPVVLTLDWLVGGDTTGLEHGTRTGLLYTMETGHIETTFTYVPPRVSDHIEESAGARVRSEIQRELSNRWSISLRGTALRSILEMDPYVLHRGEVTVRHRSDQGRVLSVTGSGGTRYYTLSEDEGEAMDVYVKEQGLTLGHRSFRLGATLGGKLFLSNAEVTVGDQEPYRENTLELEGNVSLPIVGALILGGSADVKGTWIDGELKEGNLGADARARYKYGDMYMYASGMTRGQVENDTEIEEEKSELSISVRYVPTRDISGTAELKKTYLHFVGEEYASAKLNLAYTNRENDWKAALNLGYIAPVGERDTPQVTAGASYTREIASGMEVAVEGRRVYRTIYEEEPEYILSVSASQALGFAGDAVMSQKYSQQNEHVSYIGGLVFLDTNGNGVWDEGEPLLADIPVAMDGLRTTTDEDGYFMFEHVRPGLYEVGFDMTRLMADYSIVTDSKVVRIRENENLFLHLGVTLDGIISGRVFLDREATGTREAGDEPLSWVGIYVEEIGRTVYTRSDGTFYLDNLPLGRYTVRVLSDTLPGGMRLLGDDRFVCDITPETLFVRNLSIPVVYGMSRDHFEDPQPPRAEIQEQEAVDSKPEFEETEETRSDLEPVQALEERGVDPEEVEQEPIVEDMPTPIDTASAEELTRSVETRVSIQKEEPLNDTVGLPYTPEILIATYSYPIFRIHHGINTTASERRNTVQQRVNSLLNTVNHRVAEGSLLDSRSLTDELQVERTKGEFVIVFGDQLIITVDALHASLNFSTQEGLSEVWHKNLVLALESYIDSKLRNLQHSAPEVRNVPTGEEGNGYYIQIGAFTVQENALLRKTEARERGYLAEIRESSHYRVQVEAGSSREEALLLKQALSQQGFNTFLVAL